MADQIAEVNQSDSDFEVGHAFKAAPQWASQVRQRDWMSTMRPWTIFAGLGESAPYTMPSPLEWDHRFGHNMRLFLSNYSAVVASMLLFVIVRHPLMLLGTAAACTAWWFLSQYLVAQNINVVVGGRQFSSSHLNAGFLLALFLAVLIVFGSIIFFFIGLSTSIVSVHALFRNDKQHNLGSAKGVTEEATASAPSVA